MSNSAQSHFNNPQYETSAVPIEAPAEDNVIIHYDDSILKIHGGDVTLQGHVTVNAGDMYIPPREVAFKDDVDILTDRLEEIEKQIRDSQRRLAKNLDNLLLVFGFKDIDPKKAIHITHASA